LRLDPLEANNADELLSVLLTDAAELGPFKKLIIEKSEGNPLFIEEIVRALFENGTIVREGEQVRVTRPHAEISIPATVEGIVAARIDRLSPEEKSLPVACGYRRGISVAAGATCTRKAGERTA
jgi:predicted ATPase